MGKNVKRELKKRNVNKGNLCFVWMNILKLCRAPYQEDDDDK
jgi:hypothetical protein